MTDICSINIKKYNRQDKSIFIPEEPAEDDNCKCDRKCHELQSKNRVRKGVRQEKNLEKFKIMMHVGFKKKQPDWVVEAKTYVMLLTPGRIILY